MSVHPTSASTRFRSSGVRAWNASPEPRCRCWGCVRNPTTGEALARMASNLPRQEQALTSARRPPAWPASLGGAEVGASHQAVRALTAETADRKAATGSPR
jgi:hypothetical protein